MRGLQRVSLFYKYLGLTCVERIQFIHTHTYTYAFTNLKDLANTVKVAQCGCSVSSIAI